MRCQELRNDLVETARGRSLPSDLRARVFAHSAVCPDCARQLEFERELTAALNDLLLHAGAAPARVEVALRKQLPVPVRRLRRLSWLWAAPAIAAAAALAFAVLHGTTVPRTSLPAPPVPVQAKALPPATEPSAVAATLKLPLRQKVAAAQPAVILAGDTTPFEPLPYAPEIAPEESTSVVQIEIPREALLSVGLPVNADRLSETVQADVLIGMDGTARAIRLAR